MEKFWFTIHFKNKHSHKNTNTTVMECEDNYRNLFIDADQNHNIYLYKDIYNPDLDEKTTEKEM